MIIYVLIWQVSWLHPESAFPFLHFRNSGIARVAFHQMGFTVAGTASDSTTEFPFIQIEEKISVSQTGRKGRQLFYICFKINEKMVAFERGGGFEP